MDADPARVVRVLDVDGLGRLFEFLRADGFELVGPTVRDGAVVHAPIAGVGDLPRGTGDQQAPGSYRLVERGDPQLFGWASPAQSFKRELFLPRLDVVRIRRTRDGVEVGDPRPPARRLALIG